MSNDTKTQARRAEVDADESARESASNGVMLAMFIATVFGITSVVAFPSRPVETPAGEATEQSLQESAAQPSPLPAQAPNDQAFQPLQQPIAQQSFQQPATQATVQQPIVRPSILPSEPINQDSQFSNLPAQPNGNYVAPATAQP